jgi:2-keto-4-pentenoate hydratase/2-oxohepta-3-ene-1,7-dioic acid hydratase in catechol pathway
MRLVSFDDNRPGLLRDGDVIDLSALLEGYATLAWDGRMPALIESFERLRSDLARAKGASHGVSFAKTRLCAPLPRPRKLLCELGDYNETIPEPKGATDFYLKSPDSVVGADGTVALPAGVEGPFMARGGVATVIGRSCRNCSAADGWGYVFGFTPFIDIGTEAFGRPKIGTFFGNSFDGFGPMGPWIVTADEIADPRSLHVRLLVNGQVMQDYGFSELHYSVPEQIEAASAIMTLRPGDVLVSGQFRHDGAGLKPGDALALEIAGLGELRVGVSG